MGWKRGMVVMLLFVQVIVRSEGVDAGVKIWPLPVSLTYGEKSVYFSKDFQLMTEGTKYSDKSGILRDGFSRFVDLVKVDHVVDGDFSTLDPSAALLGLHLVVFSPNIELNYGIDESYNLSIPASGKPSYAYLEAQTVYGALHGLQTFSQLCRFNFTTRVIEVGMVPWTIVDQPRFSYRGLLIDTSRHYLPLPVIQGVIDSMAYAKLNVLHWHIVDSQSFPLEIPSFPNLWEGAYSISERYTMADAAEIVSYAQRRGINVLAEIDVPGHALSWGKGYPSLWPSKDCQEPLDVSNEFTFKVIDGILSDFSKVFKFKFVHLGGDEVITSCWTKTPHIKQWLENHHMNESQAYQYFVLRAQSIALSHGYDPINWEETFNNFGKKLSPKTVVHNWLGSGVAERVVAAGLRCIVSNQDKWYLDHLDATWQGFYMNEPLTNITKPKQQKLVIGGEVCTWGEHIDGSDIEQTIWPRAAAAAERLWTSYDKLATDANQVRARLAHFRCLLNQRGVAAAPLIGPGRVAPEEPGSCYVQ
ncbi:Glyco_hydro_20 domain-containing protein/Glyco_hydro_20b domain-containing protein [Cephalotus follicularis]|uniref:Beta-hexosaminidase n=1 Tax=Cephalotus follicularis TaxID=3775 RepID=A0A1Q3D3C9_CEPFO|nr:Glyco_hydro_20 domain-containing protein/Glyco_hydro_20b domain-containing protein [Cephalotus follicularis]